MTQHTNRKLFYILAVLLLAGACIPAQPRPLSAGQATPDPGQVANQVATSVVLTVAALPSAIPPTSTPLPTSTAVVPPTPTLIPTLAYPVITPTAKPGYACDIIDQRPYDDTAFRPNASFDIKWTIVNSGTKKWEHGTYLQYQNGSEMTDITVIEMPRLKPGEKHEVILEAIAPVEQERHVMVWVVKGPGKDEGSMYWMCYPYVRIIVGK